jgi:hypothetical protein
MKSYLATFTTVLALLMGGCATPFLAPADVAHLTLERGDSPSVVVDKIWLERKRGPLVVTGSVTKRLEADTTTGTHLDVTLYDAAGQVLRRSVEYFEPREIVRRPKTLAVASYRIVLEPLPAGTARIAVKAHDGAHENP